MSSASMNVTSTGSVVNMPLSCVFVSVPVSNRSVLSGVGFLVSAKNISSA